MHAIAHPRHIPTEPGRDRPPKHHQRLLTSQILGTNKKGSTIFSTRNRSQQETGELPAAASKKLSINLQAQNLGQQLQIPAIKPACTVEAADQTTSPPKAVIGLQLIFPFIHFSRPADHNFHRLLIHVSISHLQALGQHPHTQLQHEREKISLQP